MPAKLYKALRLFTPFAGLAALVSWAIAAGQALPRLLAGPLCSAGSDGFSLAGHCPACFAAVAFTALFLASFAATRRPTAVIKA